MIGSGGYGDELNVVMVNLRPGEEKIIADRLYDILHIVTAETQPPCQPPFRTPESLRKARR